MPRHPHNGRPYDLEFERQPHGNGPIVRVGVNMTAVW